jgi:isopenicillin N synthase-like dioxygenase
MDGVNNMNCDWQDRVNRQHILAQSLINHGLVVIHKHGLNSDLIEKHYQQLHHLFSSLPSERLEQFEFLESENLERGFVSSPSGGLKPTLVALRDGKAELCLAGVRIVLDENSKKIILEHGDERSSLTIPKHVFQENQKETEAGCTFLNRRIKFRKLPDNRYEIYAPDDKKSWITSLHDNIYPREAFDFIKSCQAVYAAHMPLVVAIIRALANYLGDKSGLLLGLIQDQQGLPIGPHTMRSYQYPALPKKQMKLISDDTTIVRVGPHKDFSLITILPPSSEGGLQILKNGTWESVSIEKNSVLVMAGQVLNFLTQGMADPEGRSLEIPAILHRVMADKETIGKDRYAAPIFVNPNMKAPILSLSDGKPLHVKDKSLGMDIVLNPSLRLLYAHLSTSVKFKNISFEDYLEEYKCISQKAREIAQREQLHAVYIP